MTLSINPVLELTKKHKDLLYQADPSYDMISLYLNNSNSFEAFNNQKLIGIITVKQILSDTLEICNLSITENEQNKGYGRVLLQFIKEYAINNNYKSIIIRTGATSIGQLYLYQSEGFRPTSVDIDFFTDNYPDTIIENNIILKDRINLKLSLV